MNEMKSIDQNWLGKFIANALYSGRDFTNNVGSSMANALDTVTPGKLPRTDSGLGDFIFGKAPEYAEDRSYGMRGPISDTGSGTLDKRLIDVAGLPLPYMAAGMGMKGLIKSAVKPKASFIPPQVALENQSRRDFLKNAGMATAGVAIAPHVALKGIEKLGAKLAPDVGRAATTTAARTIGTASVPAVLGKAIAYFRAYPHLLPLLRKGGFKEVDDNIWRFNGPGNDITPGLKGYDGLDHEMVLKHFDADGKFKNDIDNWSDFNPELTQHQIDADSLDILYSKFETQMHDPDSIADFAVAHGVSPQDFANILLERKTITKTEYDRLISEMPDHQTALERYAKSFSEIGDDLDFTKSGYEYYSPDVPIDFWNSE